MHNIHYLNNLINNKTFHFEHLAITNINNEPVAKIFSQSVLEQEICLFGEKIASGDEYTHILQKKLITAIERRRPLPIARFADGEYAFYNQMLDCNGLYKQAESVDAIKKALPIHISAMKYLAENGLFAPLVFPGNCNVVEPSIFSFLQKKKDSSGADFLHFLKASEISLTAKNYIPFYSVYAYLSSGQFAKAVNEKKICILNSEFDKDNCRKWFAQFASYPSLSFVDIPAQYVATQWEAIKTEILNKIPPQTDLCIAGAGVGALLVCTDIARKFSIPAIDAGHVLNMMNGRVDKSNGARLYTLRKQT